MKQKDIGLIAVIAIVSAVFSLLLSNFLFNKPASKQQKAEVVEAISATFETPDKRFFNAKSVDPTQTIRIGDGSNGNPFAGAGQ